MFDSRNGLRQGYLEIFSGRFVFPTMREEVFRATFPEAGAFSATVDSTHYAIDPTDISAICGFSATIRFKFGKVWLVELTHRRVCEAEWDIPRSVIKVVLDEQGDWLRLMLGEEAEVLRVDGHIGFSWGTVTSMVHPIDRLPVIIVRYQ